MNLPTISIITCGHLKFYCRTLISHFVIHNSIWYVWLYLNTQHHSSNASVWKYTITWMSIPMQLEWVKQITEYHTPWDDYSSEWDMKMHLVSSPFVVKVPLNLLLFFSSTGTQISEILQKCSPECTHSNFQIIFIKFIMYNGFLKDELVLLVSINISCFWIFNTLSPDNPIYWCYLNHQAENG